MLSVLVPDLNRYTVPNSTVRFSSNLMTCIRVRFVLSQSVFPMCFRRNLHRLYLHSYLKTDLAPARLNVSLHCFYYPQYKCGISRFRDFSGINPLSSSLQQCDVVTLFTFKHIPTCKTEVFSVVWIYKFLSSLSHSYWLAAGK